MSMIQAFSLLKDVKPYKQGWRVQVKLLHSWRQKTNYGGDTLEMIFADETGVKIHCSARKNLIKKTESKIRLDVVGQVSSLRDVQTVQVAGNDKKKVEFRLMDINMPNDEFALALTATKNDKRPIKDLIDDWNDVGIISISEIITATQEEDCKIICSIESIDTDWSWFIFGHVSRNRFKLHLTVKDDTSTCKLMLLDSVAKKKTKQVHQKVLQRHFQSVREKIKLIRLQLPKKCAPSW
ncbi:hypothetical protein HID58_057645 [Brassica napus]|uniref:Replication protein A 70 kDa DNA-binding subunit B/D first OB fold domain-containing protein n=1 Tax=Brassica napus TaxID=3708 RepID=A0ABQ8ARQ3_BRANA|nr:hypothetical protein HID58_057645 [Brassica napus]